MCCGITSYREPSARLPCERSFGRETWSRQGGKQRVVQVWVEPTSSYVGRNGLAGGTDVRDPPWRSRKPSILTGIIVHRPQRQENCESASTCRQSLRRKLDDITESKLRDSSVSARVNGPFAEDEGPKVACPLTHSGDRVGEQQRGS